MNLLNYFRLKLELRRQARRIREEQDPALRAHAMYCYIEQSISALSGNRKPTIFEYELVTSYILANLMDACVNRQDVNNMIKNVRHNAGVILNENRTARGQEDNLH